MGSNDIASKKKNLTSGILAGVAGGLAAAWVMNQFSAGPGEALTQAVQTDDDKQQAAQPRPNTEPQPDATMKAADAIVSNFTDGKHLTPEQQKAGGPVVHYSFGAIMGGVYGGLSEYVPAIRAGFGTVFASVLFTAGDLIAVPAFGLGAPATQQSSSQLVTPFAAHLVYGAATEAVRRVVRRML